ncbi:putative kinesin family protein [Phaeomoniella chlamydospora]|uniref:Putative kinesin family protein n=1 Tax=Phaeomoniella chlamydospora TaxID=158046 RepID=A0A0G2EZK8_PHACM|nr:putative kinesin family protein [Phaeomoniella chlamydospora]
MRPPPRSNSRMSIGSKQGGSSRVSDDDGKTAVKVAVRVRPPLKSTDPGFELIPQRFQKSMVHVTAPTSLAVDVPQGRKLFVFDRVFDEDVTQAGVWEYLHDSVNSFVQGYNVSILAYGQSGAGKSYTMGTSGPREQNDEEVMGIIPRAAASLFEKLAGTNNRHSTGLRTPTKYSMTSMNNSLHNATRANGDRDWQLKATYVEIYNEQLRDLLLPESTPPQERANVTIREDTKGRILLTGLHQVNINSIDDLLGALNFGSSIRQTDATAINAKSSRSHAVFSLNLVLKKGPQPTSAKEKRFSVPIEAMSGSQPSVTIDSKLHFVDLAGSERLKNTGASGERAREGISINAGLASLGKVISQLSSRQAGSHVSYRDSRLTRLLQDSLGGNAITYMIACVTPAEFHLSETLNTVQYAQRARAIQSKPRIQQVSDDGDKQALIDRLKAEVAFLRQQIRNTEGGERRNGPTIERTERQNEREIELQNNLLDVQESYTALSQRHAKLISELTQNGDTSVDLHSITGESSVDRLKRSQANQQQIESMVLEYEKTIQALETNLSTTRAALANTESSLLEKETKCAYTETMNQQLHVRVQKLMDREASTDTYLHELEARIDGQSSGEEKSSALVSELRKEISRLRENEANSEDYISTLEERLAEADQDMELMQREVERLEHVVERQRSLGKLDNLLYELDHIQQNEQQPGDTKLPSVNHRAPETNGETDQQHSEDTFKVATETAIPEETDQELAEVMAEAESEVTKPVGDDDLGVLEKARSLAPKKSSRSLAAVRDEEPESPAQTKFVADKLENVTQELFDLRLEHESTMTDYDMLSAKYQEALRTLAELQDAVDEAKHPAPPSEILSPAKSRPQSFLEDPRVNELRAGGHLSGSRSLSSELSQAGESTGSAEPSEVPQTPAQETSSQAEFHQPTSPSHQNAEGEIARLTQLLIEHEMGMNALTQEYAQLQTEHQDSLDAVEELKAEIQKSKNMQPPTSPREPPNVIRRQTSQSVITVDRAHRSLASLRNIAVEEFETKPDTMQSVDVHINNAMHELHTKMERIQALEAENKSVKREMEQKATMITGLTRERNSIKASSPMDISIISQMQDQLQRNETEMAQLQAQHSEKEKQLQAELESVKTQHASAVEEKESTGKRLATTIAELEAIAAAMETMKTRSSANEDSASNAMEKERLKHQELVGSLKREIEGYTTTIANHESKIAQLEQQQAAAQQQLQEQVAVLEGKEKEYQQQIEQLQKEVEEHKSEVEFQKHGLKSLHDSHDSELAELRLAAEGVKTEHEEKLKEVNMQHEERLALLKQELDTRHKEHQSLLERISHVMNEPITEADIDAHVSKLMEAKTQAVQTHAVLTAENAELTKQLETHHGDRAELEKQIAEHTGKMADYQDRIRNLAIDVANHEETIREKDVTLRKREATIESLTTEKQNSARIIEELEQQIENSFDQHHNRLSVMQEQGNQALAEANKRVSSLEKELDEYKSRLEHVSSRPQSPPLDVARSNSLTSNLRKSASVASLPSPPPAIPLPPLPSIAQATNGAPSNSSASPPQSRHTSKDISSVQQHQAQLIEDQEARIRTIEKHLHAEKQLTATLEEALVDLETQSNKVRADMETWKKKAWAAEEELQNLRREQKTQRLSIQQVEEERDKRREAEAARAHLEERMQALSKKKKKSGLNCF